jgi:hypothetical protein
VVRYADGMADVSDAKTARDTAGLCADCQNARPVKSNRGSLFLLCELSKTDPRFPKYPRLPVLNCPGYQKKGGPP